MKVEFTASDRVQLSQLGLRENEVRDQLEQIREGFPRTQVVSVASPGAGINVISDEVAEHCMQRYSEYDGPIAKFVPASGAATRMFKRQYEYLANSNPEVNPLERSISKYPFYEALRASFAARNQSLDAADMRGAYKDIVKGILEPEGLGYGSLPKALIPFHRYSDGDVRTPIEEHMVEGALYAKMKSGEIHIHVTADKEFHGELERVFAWRATRLSQQYRASFHLHLSEQLPSSRSIAARPSGEPYRDAEGNLLFRPAGHGALLANLQRVAPDLVFIKNIDNVMPDSLKRETVRTKRLLAGMLLRTQDSIFKYLRLLESEEPTEALCDEIMEFCRRDLSYRYPLAIREAALESKIRYLKQRLNRPLRVCGVVRNEGEPGGGPFWVRKRDGTETIQIVETAQMDLDDGRVADLLSRSRYFNPVDLVCSFRDYKGGTFDLNKFVDRTTGFVAHKSHCGEEVLSLELPGLWNGSMAEWNTVLIEVPPITFCPVKELTDLLRAEHQTEEA